ncbi:MAG: NADH-quinone oxidoreductase subunit J [Alphaproteobacteria bacterium]|nr:NADH-quinone oxidoreductase subunit J [Alphaproteobacteria bacterium]
MIATDLIFYLFSSILIASAIMTVAARNPVRSILFLILCFLNVAGLFVLMGAEFVAAILVIVYAGAVAVLFLFVIMMLDVDFKEMRKRGFVYISVVAIMGMIFLAGLIVILNAWHSAPAAIGAQALSPDNARAIGRALYTDYIYPFEVSGLILLVAMIGAITLTLRKRSDVRRQNIMKQLNRRREDVIEICKVSPGEGAQ